MKILVVNLILGLFSTHLALAKNPLEYRDIKLGMTMEEIAKLESVKTGYMVNPKHLKCTKGEFKYNKFFDPKIILLQFDKTRRGIRKIADDIVICEGYKRGYQSNSARLKGNSLIFKNDISFYFYKNKLYQFNLLYSQNSQFNLDATQKKLFERYKNNEDLETHRAFSVKASNYTSKKKNMIGYQDFTAKNDPDLEIRILTDYVQITTFGINTSKQILKLRFLMWNRYLDKHIERLGEKSLAYQIRMHNEFLEDQKKQKNRDKKIKNKLDKKYNY